MSDQGQQQQQQQQQPTAFDWTPAIEKLTPEHKDFMSRKGWVKDGKAAEGFDLNAVVGSYHGLEKLQGKKTMEVPDLSNPEAFGKWEGHKLLGVPDKEDGYQFEKPQMPEGVQYDEASDKVLRTALKKANIGQSQATTLYKELVAMQVANAAQSIKARSEEAAAMDGELRKAWGVSYDDMKALGGNALRHLANEIGIPADKLVDQTASAMGNATTARLFAQLGKMLGEDMLKGGKAAGFARGPEAARQEIADLKLDKNFQDALYDKTHVGHKAAQARWNRLFELAHS